MGCVCFAPILQVMSATRLRFVQFLPLLNTCMREGSLRNNAGLRSVHPGPGYAALPAKSLETDFFHGAQLWGRPLSRQPLTWECFTEAWEYTCPKVDLNKQNREEGS